MEKIEVKNTKPLIMNKYFFFLSLSSAWMIGIGLRFIFDGYFGKRIYMVNTFDMVFDWGVLVFCGTILFIYSIYKSFKDFQYSNLEGK